MTLSRPPASSDESHYDELAAAFDRRIKRGHMSIQTFNGSTKFISAMLTVMAMLIVAAICGEVVVYGQVQTLNAEVALIIAGHTK